MLKELYKLKINYIKMQYDNFLQGYQFKKKHKFIQEDVFVIYNFMINVKDNNNFIWKNHFKIYKNLFNFNKIKIKYLNGLLNYYFLIKLIKKLLSLLEKYQLVYQIMIKIW